MALIAGSKGHLNPGDDQYTGSLAAAIESAFMQEWPAVMNNAPKPVPNDQMRLLFIAVAQGVLRYLADNELSITVNVSGVELPIKITVSGLLYNTAP